MAIKVVGMQEASRNQFSPSKFTKSNLTKTVRFAVVFSVPALKSMWSQAFDRKEDEAAKKQLSLCEVAAATLKHDIIKLLNINLTNHMKIIIIPSFQAHT